MGQNPDTGVHTPLYGALGLPRINGGGFPAQIWAQFTKDALKDSPAKDFDLDLESGADQPEIPSAAPDETSTEPATGEPSSEPPSEPASSGPPTAPPTSAEPTLPATPSEEPNPPSGPVNELFDDSDSARDSGSDDSAPQRP